MSAKSSLGMAPLTNSNAARSQALDAATASRDAANRQLRLARRRGAAACSTSSSLDLGMSHARLKAKAAGYAAYAAEAAGRSGQPRPPGRSGHPLCPCLLFLTTTETRANAFLKIVSGLLDKQGRGNYYSRRRGFFDWSVSVPEASPRRSAQPYSARMLSASSDVTPGTSSSRSVGGSCSKARAISSTPANGPTGTPTNRSSASARKSSSIGGEAPTSDPLVVQGDVGIEQIAAGRRRRAPRASMPLARGSRNVRRWSLVVARAGRVVCHCRGTDPSLTGDRHDAPGRKGLVSLRARL